MWETDGNCTLPLLLIAIACTLQEMSQLCDGCVCEHSRLCVLACRTNVARKSGNREFIDKTKQETENI